LLQPQHPWSVAPQKSLSIVSYFRCSHASRLSDKTELDASGKLLRVVDSQLHTQDFSAYEISAMRRFASSALSAILERTTAGENRTVWEDDAKCCSLFSETLINGNCWIFIQNFSSILTMETENRTNKHDDYARNEPTATLRMPIHWMGEYFDENVTSTGFAVRTFYSSLRKTNYIDSRLISLFPFSNQSEELRDLHVTAVMPWNRAVIAVTGKRLGRFTKPDAWRRLWKQQLAMLGVRPPAARLFDSRT
jgi:hypothetical protein